MKALLLLILLLLGRNAHLIDGPQADLIDAARAGDVPAVRAALAAGADPNAFDDGFRAWTPLLHAVHKGQTASAAALLEACADPNRAGAGGLTPLHMAAGYGNAPMVRLLLRHGADKRLRNRDGESALDFALTGVTDIDRFTYFSCQNEAAALLAGAPVKPASQRWARVKGC